MQSSYVFTKTHPEEEGLGVAAATVATVATAGVGIANTVASWFGGGGDGDHNVDHGSLVANIASFDRCGPQTAKQAAKKGVQMYVAGKPMKEIERKIDSICGYPPVASDNTTAAWAAIRRDIRQIGEQLKKKQAQKTNPVAAAVGGGNGWLLPAAIGVGVLGAGAMIVAAAGEDGQKFIPQQFRNKENA